MIEISNKTKADIAEKIVKNTVKVFLSIHRLSEKNVSIAFVGDKTIQKLNKKYRKKDYVTDILSFCGEGDDLGEIVINYSQIKRQAKKYSNTERQELIFILVHGLFHLIGYTDDSDEKASQMEKLGEEFIENYV